MTVKGVIAVFGASGGSGQAVVNQLLERGYQVKAYTRNPSTFPISPGEKLIVIGIKITEEVPDLSGVEAVISCLGNDQYKVSDSVITPATEKIVQAMKNANVKRLIAASSAGVNPDDPEHPMVFKKVILPTVLNKITHDHSKMEEVVSKTDLDYTLVRWPKFNSDSKVTGKYRVKIGGLPKGGWFKIPSVTYGDAGHFMVTVLEDNKYVGERPCVAV